MRVVRIGESYAVVNRRGRVIFTGTESECHQYCREVVSMPAFQEI